MVCRITIFFGKNVDKECRKSVAKDIIDMLDDIEIMEFVDCRYIIVRSARFTYSRIKSILDLVIDIVDVRNIIFMECHLGWIKDIISTFIEKLDYFNYEVNEDESCMTFCFRDREGLDMFLEWYKHGN